MHLTVPGRRRWEISRASVIVLASWIASLACGLSGCASLDKERHLAPLFSQLSTAGGGTEFESLGGAITVRRNLPGGSVKSFGFRPLFTHQWEGNTARSWFIPPFGTRKRTEDNFLFQLLPLWRYQSRSVPTGGRQWTFISLPGIYLTRREDGRIARAWFPFGGVIEGFLSFDRLDFFLWPLFTRSQRQGVTRWHFLYPLFMYGHGRGVSWRVFPIYGHSRVRDSYDRWFFLWPLFHRQRTNLGAGPERTINKWMLFPLYGQTRSGQFQSHTFLWPFFGFSRNTADGFWAFDGPWPLVRIQRPGYNSAVATRTRIWPLFSDFKGDGLHSRWWLWPFFARRLETYDTMEKESNYFVPFWISWKRNHETEGESEFQKLWPLYQREKHPGGSSFAFPALNPLWRTPVIDLHYAWMYELFRVERDGDRRSERGWLGLWRRERDRDEDRCSFTGVWGRRRYSLAGERVSETSILFGLLRWRHGPDDSFTWLKPAMPGPGWPLERVPNSILPPLPEAIAPGSDQ